MARGSRPERSAPRWMRIALVVSLGLNLAVAGLALGSAYKWQRAGGPPRSVDLSLGPLGRALGEEDRRVVIGELRHHGQGARPDFREMHRRSEALLALLRAERFDAEAFVAGLDGIRGMALELQQVGQAALVARIANMDPAERRALADRFEAQTQRGMRATDHPGQRSE